MNRKSPPRTGPCMPAAGRQKKPGQGWPSYAYHWAPERALARTVSLAPVAAGFPAHLAPEGLPQSK